MRNLFQYLVFAACFFFAAEFGYACSCVPPSAEFSNDAEKYVAHERDKAAAVFSGKVAGIVQLKNAQGKATGVIRVRFTVYKSWKGAETKSVTVRTTNICCICGFPFKIGKEYLVYAAGSDSKSLSASICSRTKTLDAAAEDLEFLGEAKTTSETNKTGISFESGKAKP